MIDGLRYAVIPDPDRKTTLLVLYATPLPGNHWGVLAPFRDTSWGARIPTVTGEALSHALHGRPKPLREQLGKPARERARRVPEEDSVCRDYDSAACSIGTVNCVPGSGKLPRCYEAPTENRDLRLLATAIGQAWDEGRYVFVVEGPEFLVT